MLSYIPSFSPEWCLQMGNIGAHYYDWRYKNAGQQAFPKLNVQPVTVSAGQLGSKERPIHKVYTTSVKSQAITTNGPPLAALFSQITGYSITVPVPATSYAVVIES